MKAGQCLPQSGERFQHHAINGTGALTSAEDQKGLLYGAGSFFLQEEFFAHRDSGHARIAKIFFGLFKMDGRRRNQPRHHAIGKSGNHVGLKGKGWSAPQPGGEHGGARGVSADADDYVRTEIAQHAPAGQYGARQIKERAQTCSQADILERAHLNEPQLESRGGDQTVLNAARRANEEYLNLITPPAFPGPYEGAL